MPHYEDGGSFLNERYAPFEPGADENMNSELDAMGSFKEVNDAREHEDCETIKHAAKAAYERKALLHPLLLGLEDLLRNNGFEEYTTLRSAIENITSDAEVDRFLSGVSKESRFYNDPAAFAELRKNLEAAVKDGSNALWYSMTIPEAIDALNKEVAAAEESVALGRKGTETDEEPSIGERKNFLDLCATLAMVRQNGTADVRARIDHGTLFRTVIQCRNHEAAHDLFYSLSLPGAKCALDGREITITAEVDKGVLDDAREEYSWIRKGSF